MNTRVHVLAGIAAAALRSSVVSATERTGPLPWCVAAFVAALPDIAEWLLRNARRPDATLTPDPLLADDLIAETAVRSVADAAKHARDSGRAVRLRIRPLPAARGLLRLRILPRRVEACIVPGDTAPHSAAIPSSATPWPGVLDVAPPEGVILSFAPASGKNLAIDIAAHAPGRGRDLPHSPLLLLVLPALLLFVPGYPLLSAAALGLLSHGLLDLLGDQGLPLRYRNAPGLGLHLFRDASPIATRNIAILSAAVLAVGIVCNTPFVLHRTRLCAVLLGAACAALLLRDVTSGRDRSPSGPPSGRTLP